MPPATAKCHLVRKSRRGFRVALPERQRLIQKGDRTMQHQITTREKWLVARKELLEAEKELTRRSDEVARQRQELPWVRVDKQYPFETDDGKASLPDLFKGRSQLLVYH